MQASGPMESSPSLDCAPQTLRVGEAFARAPKALAGQALVGYRRGVRAPSFAASVLCLAACTPAASPSPEVPLDEPAATVAREFAPVASASSTTPTRLAIPQTLCEAVTLQQRETLRPFLRLQKYVPPTMSVTQDLCLPDAQGAWAIVFVEASVIGGYEVEWVGLQGRWAVARLGLDGKELARSETVPFYANRDLPTPRAYVWKEGQIPHVLLGESVAREEAPDRDESRLHVLRFHEGRVTPAPGTEGLSIYLGSDRDLDGDGREDFEYAGPFAGRPGKNALGNMPAMGLHALPDGSFSATDAIARRASFRGMTSCALPPPSPGETQDYEIALSTRCFALLGQPAKAAAVAARCAPNKGEWCKMARRWAGAQSPFPAASAPPPPE